MAFNVLIIYLLGCLNQQDASKLEKHIKIQLSGRNFFIRRSRAEQQTL